VRKAVESIIRQVIVTGRADCPTSRIISAFSDAEYGYNGYTGYTGYTGYYGGDPGAAIGLGILGGVLGGIP
jgi:hypothetical protein